jgi:hypothetical protein
MPKFIYLLHASPESESGALPTADIIETMTNYNTALSDAGLLLDGDGFKDSRHAARLAFPVPETKGKTEPEIARGPFPLSGLLCAYWLIQAKSLDEAVENSTPFARTELREGVEV